MSRRAGNRQEPENGQPRDGGPRMILVTSPGPGEGKSTVAANLAVAYAELGRSVVLVSCDFHRPRLHKLFGIQNDRGLTDAVQSSRSRSLDGYAQLVTDRPHEVRLVPSGSPPGSPSELLSSEKMRKFLERAREEWDVVILDTAPLLAATDATHLLEDADAVLVVGRAGRTTADEASRTRELLDRLGAATVGVALTAVAEGTLPRRYSWYLASGDGSRKERAKEAEKAGGKASTRGRDAEREKDGEASEKDGGDAGGEKDGGEENSGAEEGDKGIPRLAGHSEEA